MVVSTSALITAGRRATSRFGGAPSGGGLSAGPLDPREGPPELRGASPAGSAGASGAARPGPASDFAPSPSEGGAGPAAPAPPVVPALPAAPSLPPTGGFVWLRPGFVSLVPV